MSVHQTNCPYCGKINWIELDGQDASSEYDYECSKCKKEFSYYLDFSVDIISFEKESKQ